jgi:hypothetical protein
VIKTGCGLKGSSEGLVFWGPESKRKHNELGLPTASTC